MATHKRTSSAAGNTQDPSQAKRQAQDVPDPSEPQYVYIVVEDMKPQYTDSASIIRGVYSTIKDANNAVKRIVYSDYENAEECRRGTEDDGRVYWSSEDIGEGDGTEIRIEVKEVKGPGSEPDREWGDDGAQDEDAEDEDGEEDEENDEEHDEDEADDEDVN